jgi:sRNA-binding carbon storage regulator CsrA
MFLKVKNYESYIDFYPGTDIPKEVFESGKTFEIQDELFDIRQKDKVVVVEAPQKEIEIEEPKKEEIVSSEIVLPIEEDEKKSARQRALEKLKGNPSSGLHTNSPGPI